ncbi:hypothetical protein MMF93_19170 [Streptomyces tubbatahanensis]|uniref:DUF6879 domain-containing protein n=1 Tax=Streptomyces tubbatahanensis TaxID=2923272 RepID=A0ABY3XV23_9ACTN|nr:DUF6879 family protein [Streptomyces tubbatahanensis]UNS98336.1 hypothetical protein MMF93_19170 [Streptomyces tubbatahanensis]
MQSRIPPFDELLGRCRSSAVHLEMRDSYGTNPRLESWKRGRRTNWGDRSSWWRPFHDAIADAVGRGVSVRRARVVSEPVSDYIRWEHYATEGNVIAGEEVRWLPRSRSTDLLLPGNDFWLFDGGLLRIHHFAGDGSLVEDEMRQEGALVRQCASAFEAVWQRAVPHEQYAI